MRLSRIVTAVALVAGVLIVPARANADPISNPCVAWEFFEVAAPDPSITHYHVFQGEVSVGDGVLRYWHISSVTETSSGFYTSYVGGYAVLCRSGIQVRHIDLTTSVLLDPSTPVCALADFTAWHKEISHHHKFINAMNTESGGDPWSYRAYWLHTWWDPSDPNSTTSSGWNADVAWCSYYTL